MHGEVGIFSPEVIEHDSQTELKFIFHSKDNVAYHIRSVYLSPTWDLENQVQRSVDKVVHPDTEKIINTGEFYFPPYLGGKQGFRIGFEASPYFGEEMEYETVWAGPVRKSVSNTTSVNAVIYNHNPELETAEIQRLLDFWGFETKNKEPNVDPDRALEDIRSSEPSCLFILLGQEDIESAVSPIQKLVTAAVEEEVWPLIFTTDRFHEEILPASAIIISCDISDYNDIERKSGVFLYAVRFSDGGGVSSLLFERFIERLENSIEESTPTGREALREIVKTVFYGSLLRWSGAYEKVDETLRSAADELSTYSGDSRQQSVNLTHLADAESQVLDVRPFYDDDPIWYEDKWYDERQKDRNRAFPKVVEEELLPESYANISIYWDNTQPDLFESINYHTNRMEKVYESDRVGRLSVEVPKMGTYAVSSEDGTTSWISFESPAFGAYETSSNRGIGGNLLKIFDNGDEIESIVVGCPTGNSSLVGSVRDFALDKPHRSFPMRRTWYID